MLTPDFTPGPYWTRKRPREQFSKKDLGTSDLEERRGAQETSLNEMGEAALKPTGGKWTLRRRCEAEAGNPGLTGQSEQRRGRGEKTSVANPPRFCAKSLA